MPLPTATAIHDALALCKDSAERAALKADYVHEFFTAAKTGSKYAYIYGDYRITVTGAERVGKAVWFTCSATKSGKPVDVGEGRFGFVNPPLQVTEGTIAVLAALKEMLGQAVSEYVVRHG